LRADQLAFTAGGPLLPEAGYPQGPSADLSYMPVADDRCVPLGHSVVVIARREEATDFRIDPVDRHLFEGVDLVQ
jgi:hypothetical protein